MAERDTDRPRSANSLESSLWLSQGKDRALGGMGVGSGGEDTIPPPQLSHFSKTIVKR